MKDWLGDVDGQIEDVWADRDCCSPSRRHLRNIIGKPCEHLHIGLFWHPRVGESTGGWGSMSLAYFVECLFIRLHFCPTDIFDCGRWWRRNGDLLPLWPWFGRGANGGWVWDERWWVGPRGRASPPRLGPNCTLVLPRREPDYVRSRIWCLSLAPDHQLSQAS